MAITVDRLGRHPRVTQGSILQLGSRRRRGYASKGRNEKRQTSTQPPARRDDKVDDDMNGEFETQPKPNCKNDEHEGSRRLIDQHSNRHRYRSRQGREEGEVTADDTIQDEYRGRGNEMVERGMMKKREYMRDVRPDEPEEGKGYEDIVERGGVHDAEGVRRRWWKVNQVDEEPSVVVERFICAWGQLEWRDSPSL